MAAAVAATAVVVVVVATAVVITAMVVVATAATAVGGLNLFGSGVANGEDLAVETHGFACKGVVEVHLHFGVGDFFDEAVDAVAVGCHHGHEGADFDDVLVKFAVDHKHVAVELDNLIGIVGAECFFGGGGYVEFAADFESFDGFFKGDDHAAGNTEDDFFGIGGICLVNEFLAAVGFDSIEVITQLNIFPRFNSFHNSDVFCYCLIFRMAGRQPVGVGRTNMCGLLVTVGDGRTKVRHYSLFASDSKRPALRAAIDTMI